MDYRKFLNKQEERVLPYFGGPTVHALDRRLRVAQPFEPPGWYRFEVKGRVATPKGRAEPAELSALPPVRGHVLGRRLVREGAVAEPLELMPEEEPPRFSPCRARRWPSGELLFEELEFEGEAEEAARRALEEGGSLAAVKGASAPLRAAFGYALIEETSRRLGIPAAPAEVRGQVGAVAERGPAEAEAVLRRLAEERTRMERERRELARREEAARVAEAALQERERRREEARRAGRTPEQDAPERAEAACVAAGARLRSVRALGQGHLETVYTFMGERFISVVEAETLRVVDAGICLAGADSRVTLESLFPVIREAIDTDQLVITRHA